MWFRRPLAGVASTEISNSPSASSARSCPDRTSTVFIVSSQSVK